MFDTSLFWKDFLDISEMIGAWLMRHVFTAELMTQIGIGAAGLILAFYVGVHFGHWTFQHFPPTGGKHSVRRILVRVARRQAFPLTLLLWVTGATLVYELLGLPHQALDKISALAIAWSVSRLFSAFISNPIISHSVATLIWGVAALQILGYLPRTIEWLDSIKLSRGYKGLSLYGLLSSLFSVAVSLWLAMFIANLIERNLHHNTTLSASTQALLAKISKVVLLTLACLIGLNIVGVDLTAFAVFGGAVGVGIGLGLQNVFSNLIAGFILLLDKSIKPGDTIVIDEQYGRVSHLSARYVSIVTRNGTEHLIPNDELINSKVENWSYTDPNVRLKIPIGIHYQSDVKQAINLCVEAAAKVSRVLEYPAPACLLKGFGDHAVDLELRIWIRDPMNGCSNVMSQVLLEVWERFQQHGIKFPYPQRDLHVCSVDAETARLFTRHTQQERG
ncbi:mechanosensitive ion channel family protein [Thiothrix nivea]|uniref:MscS Mechanosensitive ion channel n=1 Tax=Thiothrix nivea (strain ATCC 35100 / DSM 5205 / JP2) TaxID=870187 RepID=A0A656HGT1_THINJ|nr:mechanosensitive ion channel domain-containing protein [Thiothrix nivea]EIJ35234.1 MscS Mechanosensitive ion channel [Thiothrix nivea DSM 5205]